MNREFENLGELIEEVCRDKQANGAGASVLNRYPVRFVLFDNFADSKAFVDELLALGNVTKMGKIVDWMNAECPDQMLTYSELGNGICRYVSENETADCVIVPFSELARFYDNDEAKEFDALVGKIKGIETTSRGFEQRQRVYVPMIGQLGKMAHFFDDTQSVIWHCKSSAVENNCRVILSRSTYGVVGLEEDYAVVPNLTTWLELWRGEELRRKFVCTSPSINALAHIAQPDNAFNYTVCDNAYEFLTNGLQLNFGDITYRTEDESNWEMLASNVELRNFSFDDFFNRYFDIYDLDDAEVFLKTWFDHTAHFERWLLTTYYLHRFCGQGYICRVLREMNSYSNQDFVTAAALCVFDVEGNRLALLDEREVVMSAAEKHHVQISEEAEARLQEHLETVAREEGYEKALRYLTGLTTAEKSLLIKWVGEERVSVGKVGRIYPELRHYLDKSFGDATAGKRWVLDYMDDYKQAKVGNKYTEAVKNVILKKNASEATFRSWFNMFKTVRSELDAREDIEVFYWIDGLGIDWIPFIKWLVDGYKSENVFLNEIIIARAQLPTTTERNKPELLKLAGEGLSKKGDLDAFAHKCTPYPRYIIEEMEIVEQAVSDIVHEHAGKKVAIVSDHGLSYLSQLCSGCNLGGIQSDHCGRVVVRQMGLATQDDKYVVLDDERTLCALRHESLSAKVARGQGCHGGCTPEEVLVPIIVLSAQPKSSEFSISLIDNEVSGANPVLTFRIKGATAMDVPTLIYNKESYQLTDMGNGRFVSSRLAVQQDVVDAEVRIGTYVQTFKLKINLGAEEDDIFDL